MAKKPWQDLHRTTSSHALDSVCHAGRRPADCAGQHTVDATRSSQRWLPPRGVRTPGRIRVGSASGI